MTAEKIRQSEFAAAHKLLPGEVKQLREKHLTEGTDFWSEGRAIFWTEEAATKVRLAMAFSASENPPIDPDMPAVIAGFPISASHKANAIPMGEDRNVNIPFTFTSISLDGQVEEIDLSAFQPQGEDAAHEVAERVRATRQARVLKPCRNKRFVYASLDGIQIGVNVGNTKFQKLKGKTINVRHDAQSDSYTYVP